MTVPAAWALQTCLYDALSADPAVQSLLGASPRLFDTIPSDALYPLVELGATKNTPYPGVEGGVEHIVRFSAWSRWGGRKECKAIADAIQQLLQNASLAMEDHEMIQARIVFEDHLKYREPDLFQAVMRYRFVTIPKSVGEAA